MSLLRLSYLRKAETRSDKESSSQIGLHLYIHIFNFYSGVMPEDTQELVNQFQNFQQQLQNILIQKESLKIQNLEIDRALEELNATNQKAAYKMTGQIMVNKPVEELKKELTETKENVDIRIKSLEKNEERITNKLKELQTKLKEVFK